MRTLVKRILSALFSRQNRKRGTREVCNAYGGSHPEAARNAPPLLVVAGNYAEYAYFCHERRLNPGRDARYVRSPHEVHGYGSGIRFVRYGTWSERWRELESVLDCLRRLERQGRAISLEPAEVLPVFKVTVMSWSSGLELHIDDVGVTQSHDMKDAEEMVRDLIERRTGMASGSFRIEFIGTNATGTAGCDQL